MGRRGRNQSEPLCYHLTHRCHGRDYLLRFVKDRRSYLKRLHEMSRRYPIDVLTYMVTGNHVHLLVWAKRARAVSDAMHFLQGTVAGDYNRRTEREGAFWRGRYHPTLVESGSHLSRCLFYIDLNMLRARRCQHPSEWVGGGYQEVLGNRQRYRIISRNRLKWCLGLSDRPDLVFESWYKATVEGEVQRAYLVRQPFWSEALAVGSEEWIADLLPNVRNVRIERADLPDEIAEGLGTYAAYVPKRDAEAFWRENGA